MYICSFAMSDRIWIPSLLKTGKGGQQKNLCFRKITNLSKDLQQKYQHQQKGMTITTCDFSFLSIKRERDKALVWNIFCADPLSFSISTLQLALVDEGKFMKDRQKYREEKNRQKYKVFTSYSWQLSFEHRSTRIHIFPTSPQISIGQEQGNGNDFPIYIYITVPFQF